MKIRAVWQFFEAEAEGDSLHLFEPGSAVPLHTFRFGRPAAGRFSVLERLRFCQRKRGQRDIWLCSC